MINGRATLASFTLCLQGQGIRPEIKLKNIHRERFAVIRAKRKYGESETEREWEREESSKEIERVETGRAEVEKQDSTRGNPGKVPCQRERDAGATDWRRSIPT